MDAISVVGYFAFFWLFLFNKRFRETRIAEWQSANRLERFFMSMEAISSILFGVILPIGLLVAIARR